MAKAATQSSGKSVDGSVFDGLVKNNRRRNFSFGNIAATVVSYDIDKNTAVVRPLGMEAVKDLGDEITIRLARTSENAKSPDIREMATGEQDSRMKTPVGGILQFDNVRRSGDIFEASWVNLLAKNPETNPVLGNVHARIGPVLDSKGEPVLSKRKNPILTVNVMMADQGEIVADIDALEAQMGKCWDNAHIGVRSSSRSAIVDLITPDGVLLTRTTVTRGYDKEAEAPRSVEKALESFYSRFNGGKEAFAAAVELGTVVVYPGFQAVVGDRTSEMLANASKDIDDPARHRSRKVDLGSFMMGLNKADKPYYGYAQANIAFKKMEGEDGQEPGVIITHFRKVSGLHPVPLVAINTPQVPDAYKQWKALDDERKAESAADAAKGNDADAEAAASGKSQAQTDDNDMSDVNDDVSSILDDFDGMDEGIDDSPQP